MAIRRSHSDCDRASFTSSRRFPCAPTIAGAVMRDQITQFRRTRSHCTRHRRPHVLRKLLDGLADHLQVEEDRVEGCFV